MKRIILIFALAAGLLSPIALGSGQGFAADVFNNCGNGSAAGTPAACQDANTQDANNGQNNPIVKIIKTAIRILSYVVGIAAIIGIVVSGIRFMTAGGDSNAVASARSGLIYSLVGIAVVVLAQVIVVFVLEKL
jgi:hypothetical protein